ncbi:MAG: mannonate dehydratase [Mesorhizobium sp.]|nr:MAG: mannonate dehydratase [Mesorhizobium sp.]
MEQTWRWFGPQDPISLDHVRQTGATGVVTALHHIDDNTVWSADEIDRRKTVIERAGLSWSVVESIPIPSIIKQGGAAAQKAIAVWKDSLANVGRAGIPVVCYNFMPVVDWTRTDLLFRVPTTGYALRFDMIDFIGYDAFVLRRANAEGDYPADAVRRAHSRIASKTEAEIALLERNIIAGLPGGAAVQTRSSIASEIANFKDIDADAMRRNMVQFVQEVSAIAEDVGVRLAIHPDDPPFSLFGLPRVVSTAEDVRHLVGAVESPANGITLCAGSYGSRSDNDVLAIASEFSSKINFAHLRNVTIEPDGSFFEDQHLEGGTDMVALIGILLAEERSARADTRARQIPIRSDHGHLLGSDGERPTNPGYSYIGRLKGLAELRGIIRTLESQSVGTQ